MKLVKTQPMSLLQAYLRNPRTQRTLSLKPGEKGFSLIELVVVVAVLAILAAIAVPAFMGMNEQAADSAMESNRKNAYKECAYQLARQQNNRGLGYANFAFPGDDGFYTYTSNADEQDDPGVHSCYQDGGAPTVLTATKANSTNDYGNGAYTMEVVNGTAGEPAE